MIYNLCTMQTFANKRQLFAIYYERFWDISNITITAIIDNSYVGEEQYDISTKCLYSYTEKQSLHRHFVFEKK